jgi:hypothetical protein
MGENKITKERFDGTQVEVLGETYDPGSPTEGDKYDWSSRVGQDRAELLRFLKTGLRYWYSNDWFGSEKRKNPA